METNPPKVSCKRYKTACGCPYGGYRYAVVASTLGNAFVNGPIHRPHAVADLNQSETRNAAIFSADFSLTLVSQTTAWHTLTQCGFVVFGSITLTQQNGCMGAYRVIDLEQFPVRISTDRAPTPLTKFGISSFFFFFFCHSPFFLSFFVCIALSDSWRFSQF